MNQGKKPRAKTLLVGKKLMGKNLNENWHISTILKKSVLFFGTNPGLLNAYLLFGKE